MATGSALMTAVQTARLPEPAVEYYDWQLQAACRGVDSQVFFHPEGERGRARTQREQDAKGICRGCPVQQACLEHALAVREPYGVWGGLGETERRELLAYWAALDKQDTPVSTG